MRVLLVHGMGRTPASMFLLARALKRAGCEPQQFGYLAATQPVETIVSRLMSRLTALASAPPYAVIGHSLGGLFLRAAVTALPPGVKRPECLIMLGTPNHSPRLARRFSGALWFRFLNGDSGRLLASHERMEAIPQLDVPCTVIAGNAGPRGKLSLFGAEENDGLVAVDEARMNAGEEFITLPLYHPFMMNNRRVRELILARCTSPGRITTEEAVPSAPSR